MRLLMVFELLAHRELRTAPFAGTNERPSSDLMLGGHMFAQEMALGERRPASSTHMLLPRIMQRLMPAHMRERPKTFPAPISRTSKRPLLVRTVRAHMCSEVCRARIRRPAGGTDVRPLARVRPLVLGEPRGLGIRLPAPGVRARVPPLSAGGGEGRALRSPPGGWWWTCASASAAFALDASSLDYVVRV
jgi:hypothetical protein